MSGSLGISWVHSGAHSVRRVHSCSRMFTRVRVGVAGITMVRKVSVGRAYGSAGLFGMGLVHSGEPSCRRVHSGSRGFNRARLGVAGFILLRMGSLSRA